MRVAIYSRKSIETDTGESVKNQIKLCKEYFERQNSNCKFEIFEDEGFSGGNTNRPSFLRMMELVKIKQFDIVAVYKIDRVARNIVDFVNIYDDIDKMGVKLVSITEGFDPSTPAGKMMMLLLASFAEMERMNIAQRVKDNMKELAKIGRWSGGTPPTGYTTKKVIENDKKITYLELINDEAPYIKDMFILYSQGFSTYQINKYFKEKGLDYPQKTIQNILINPTYLISSKDSIKYLESQGYTIYGEPNGFGFLPYNRRPKTKGKKSWNDKSKFVGISKHIAIINLELWIEVQEKIREKASDPRPRESNFSYLSGGLLKCTCGASLYIDPGKRRKDGTRNYYFRCISKKNGNFCLNDSVRMDFVEKYINSYLLEFVNNKEKLKEFINKNNSRDFTKELNDIKKKISTNDKAINNLVEKLMLLSNEASSIITKKIEELALQNNCLKDALLKIEREKLFEEHEKFNFDILYDNIVNFVSLDMSVEEKKMKIKSIIEYVIVDCKNKKFYVKFII